MGEIVSLDDFRGRRKREAEIIPFPRRHDGVRVRRAHPIPGVTYVSVIRWGATVQIIPPYQVDDKGVPEPPPEAA